MELCLAVRLGLISAGPQLKLKYGRHRIIVFLLQILTGLFQLSFLGSEINRALGLKLLNEILHLGYVFVEFLYLGSHFFFFRTPQLIHFAHHIIHFRLPTVKFNLNGSAVTFGVHNDLPLRVNPPVADLLFVIRNQ
jgi:hypothetical protein